MYYSTIQPLSNKLYDKKATIYFPSEKAIRANLLYFHGGGLLYGVRDDLPISHIEAFTDAGFCIIAFDYPLAPNADIRIILEDVKESIFTYLQDEMQGVDTSVPFFLWGRSAGAYLCILSCAKTLPQEVQMQIRGVISYYGYGFLSDHWFDSVNPYYAALPPVPQKAIPHFPSFNAHAPIETHFNAYVYARQSGNWRSLFYQGSVDDFLSQFSLRDIDRFPTALFCAHSMNDADVPYDEFLAICEKYTVTRYVSASKDHDFDRTDSSFLQLQLYQATIRFIEKQMPTE